MHNETSHSQAFELLYKSVTFLQSELRSKDKIIKTLLETQTVVLDTVSKKRTSNTMRNEENVIVIDNEILSVSLPSRSLQAPSKENNSLKEHQHQTQEIVTSN